MVFQIWIPLPLTSYCIEVSEEEYHSLARDGVLSATVLSLIQDCQLPLSQVELFCVNLNVAF
jgi:hypothetical protein